MGKINKENFRGKSLRLQNWDYSWYSRYFVTIITKDREHYFGEIVDGKMLLSEIGKVAKSEWLKTPGIRPDMNLTLDEFVIMPNHFHGIIQIGRNPYNEFTGSNDAKHRVITADPILEKQLPQTKHQFGPQRKNLASIIRGFKSTVTSNARKMGTEFAWHPRFYEQIIKDKKSFDHIRKYIKENPEHWNEDELNLMQDKSRT